MFAADIQPPCASRARSRLPPHVSFQITAVCENRDPSGPIFPPSPIFENIGQKCTFFPTVPKNLTEILGFSPDFTGFLLWIGHISLFSLYIPKNLRNFGHSRKNSLSMPKKGLTLLPVPVYNDRTGLLRLRRAASADKFPSAV